MLVTVGRSDDEVAMLTEAYYLPDLGPATRSDVVPSTEYPVKHVFLVVEEIGGRIGGRDVGCPSDYLNCVPRQGYEYHARDYCPDWDFVRDCSCQSFGCCDPTCAGDVRQVCPPLCEGVDYQAADHGGQHRYQNSPSLPEYYILHRGDVSDVTFFLEPVDDLWNTLS